MNLQLTLYTKRLVLRPFYIEDSKSVKVLAGNKLIADVTSNIPHPYTESMAKEWILSHSQKWKNQELASFAIVTKESGLLIGAISLMNLIEKEAELGYWVGVEYWNNGYCSEACKEIIDFGFSYFKLKRIHARHLNRNPASGKVLLNSGLLHTGSNEKICGYRQKNEKIEYYEIFAT